MSILIKGMEMPTSCYECPFLDYEQGFCFASAVKIESGWYEPILCPGGIKDGRHDDCPLVPVPPHGRLIEKHDVFKLISAFPEIDKLLTVEFMKALYNLPTIIPASEEGE